MSEIAARAEDMLRGSRGGAAASRLAALRSGLRIGASLLVVCIMGSFAGAEDAPPEAQAQGKVAAEFIKDGEPDVDKIMAWFDDLYRSESSVARVELTVIKPRKSRTFRMKMWTKGEEKALIVIESPAR
ncbi:MAG: hypothetical protein ACYTFI_24020, partial [Planctomycetota bacterium]